MKARKKIGTIQQRQVSPLERKLPAALQKQDAPECTKCKKVLTQQRNSKRKTYSRHDP